MAYCPICDIKFRSKSGLQGHFRFKHRIERESGRPATETAMTKAIGNQIERMRSGDALMRELEGRKSESRNEENDFREVKEYSFRGLNRALERWKKESPFGNLNRALDRWK